MQALIYNKITAQHVNESILTCCLVTNHRTYRKMHRRYCRLHYNYANVMSPSKMSSKASAKKQELHNNRLYKSSRSNVLSFSSKRKRSKHFRSKFKLQVPNKLLWKGHQVLAQLSINRNQSRLVRKCRLKVWHQPKYCPTLLIIMACSRNPSWQLTISLNHK